MPVAVAPIVSTSELTKEYAGFRAIDGVSLEIARERTHAIIGPNGAGKTTLFNLLSGFTPPTSGKIVFDLHGDGGRDITGMPPAVLAQLGIIRSFQITSIFPHLTVLDNVKVSLQAKTSLSQRLLASASATRELDEPARRILESVGMESLANHLAAHLPYGRKRSLELAISLAQDPPLLLLDEPTAGMGAEDVVRTIELIKRIAKGRTIVLVEHNLRVVEDVCDRVTVMQRGRVLVEGTYKEVRTDARVVDAYLGGGAH